MDGRCPPACPRNSNVGVAPACPPLGASQYKGTWDVVYKIARQVRELQYSDLYLWLHELCTVQKKQLLQTLAVFNGKCISTGHLP